MICTDVWYHQSIVLFRKCNILGTSSILKALLKLISKTNDSLKMEICTLLGVTSSDFFANAHIPKYFRMMVNFVFKYSSKLMFLHV